MAAKNPWANIKDLPPEWRKYLEFVGKDRYNAYAYGTNMRRRVEPAPRYVQNEGDHVVGAENNQRIVLHRDNFAYGACDRSSGTAPSGRMGTGAISLTVGGGKSDRGKRNPAYSIGGPNYTYQNTRTDSAMICLTEHSAPGVGIDGAMGASDSTPYSHVGHASGVGIKGDVICIAGRQGVSILGSNRREERNSLGGINATLAGITLIGADSADVDIQPLVKGDNLVMGLKRLNSHILDLSGIVLGFLTTQIIYNTTIAAHTHFSPFFALPTTPSPTCFVQGISTVLYQFETSWMDDLYNKCNLIMWQLNYTDEVGAGFINSRQNDTT